MHCSVSLSVCTIDSYILHNSAAASALRGHLAYGKWVHECAHNVESIGKARYTVQLFLSQASFSEASQRALNVFIQIIRTDVLAPCITQKQAKKSVLITEIVRLETESQITEVSNFFFTNIDGDTMVRV